MTAWVRSTTGAAEDGVQEMPSGLAAIAELLLHEEVVPAAQAMLWFCHATRPAVHATRVATNAAQTLGCRVPLPVSWQAGSPILRKISNRSA